jgi:hypothetical protein
MSIIASRVNTVLPHCAVAHVASPSNAPHARSPNTLTVIKAARRPTERELAPRLTYIHLVYVFSSPLTIGYILSSHRMFSGVAAEVVGTGATPGKDMKDAKQRSGESGACSSLRLALLA